FWDTNCFMKAPLNCGKYTKGDFMRENILLYFVKYPTPGKVKTRLAKTVGVDEAARLYRKLAEKNFREGTLLHQRKVCDLIVVFDPPKQKVDVQDWLSAPCEYWPQSEGGLSERFISVFHDAFENGGQRVIALGSDTLGLTFQIIEEAFENLNTNDVVIGPAEDGGYYLVGSSSFQPKLFEGIPWSTSNVLAQTYKTINKLHLSYQTLRQLEDLDEIKTGEKYELIDH
ncbi:MAG: TIGR04282 family arsenosugar biosynthesis glycosyltransferase, partial [Candidatus Omnitrophica bacterium]|nr:TIGR04282 family arsenosugar biosynthesis glycosyltransferase [Candidatus Omnitrophota bacterium]